MHSRWKNSPISVYLAIGVLYGLLWLAGPPEVPAQGYASIYAPRLAMHLSGEERGKLGGVPPDALFGALDPVVARWRLNQIIPHRYRWKQWEYTNYAKDFYQRYIDWSLTGDYFYDVFGDAVAQGWLVYDWGQTQPRKFGSSLLQSDSYRWMFSNLVIATDTKGEYHYSVIIGDEIGTILTPLTFSKPNFNGIRWDIEFDEYTGTFLLSRISSPGIGANFRGIPTERANSTHLVGGRLLRSLGDFITVGTTFVNAHQSNTLIGFGAADPFAGSLTTEQNGEYISTVRIILSDDSPVDGVGGVVLFDQRVTITDLEGRRIRGDEIGFAPIIEGESEHPGYRTADGSQLIALTYDFTGPLYHGPAPSQIDHLTFELALANDYKVEVTSDRQTDADGAMVPLTVARADGNVTDKSNPILLRFDYGLPTANQILGFSLDVIDIGGFGLQGELAVNTRYLQYPNKSRRKHHISSLDATAWYTNLSYRRYPWFLFAEGFHMDDDYTTSSFLTGNRGEIDYADEFVYRYEFVDDNDDFDRYPDWRRMSVDPLAADQAVFPGLDENGDFISDFNQNDNGGRRNLLPDYEEPFIRYGVDRPEYLPGVDMNNNGWIDRFENDDQPDYLYRRDHEGYNVYAGAYLSPSTRLMLGQTRGRLISGYGRNLTTYLLFAIDEDSPHLGSWRFFQYLRLAKDTIPDDLFQWIQPINAEPTHREVKDPLSCQNTWINTTFLGYEYHPTFDFHFINKMKYELLHQRDSEDLLKERNANRNAHFLGIINKMDYTHKLGGWTIRPRWKSEFLVERPYLRTDPRRKELRETFSLIFKTGFAKRHKGRVFKSTTLETGVELTYFNQLEEPAPMGVEKDFFGTVFVTQFTSYSTYLGYRLITQAGFRLNRQDYEDEPTRVTGTSFVTVFAGIQE